VILKRAVHSEIGGSRAPRRATGETKREVKRVRVIASAVAAAGRRGTTRARESTQHQRRKAVNYSAAWRSI
jgi:hypothetical protein